MILAEGMGVVLFVCFILAVGFAAALADKAKKQNDTIIEQQKIIEVYEKLMDHFELKEQARETILKKFVEKTTC